MDITISLITTLVLTLINGYFSMSEMALTTAKRAVLEHDAEEGDKRAERAVQLAADSDQLLATIQVAITLVGFASSAVASTSLSDPLATWLMSFGIAPLSAIARGLAPVIITVAVAFVSIVIGELVPKRIGLANAEGVSKQVVGPLSVFQKIARPLVWLTGACSDGLARILRIKSADDRQNVSEEEIKYMVSEQDDLLDEEKRMIHEIFDLGDTVAREVMVPRVDTTMCEDDETVADVLSTMRQTGFSRIPVYHEDPDNVAGIAHIKDLIQPALDGKGDQPIAGFLRDATFVPDTKDILPLLSEMQTSHDQIVVVVDEYGGTAGIITIEDIVEEIVGEIEDEFDPDNVAGIAHIKDLIQPALDGKGDQPIAGFLRDATFVPDTKDILPLLSEMQTSHDQIVVVVDEYGGTAGIITIEDIVEEIVGEIEDEFDPDNKYLTRLSRREWLVDGRFSCDDAIELGWPLEESDDYETIAGWILELCDSVPDIGEVFEVAGYKFKVQSMRGQRISLIRVIAPAETDKKDSESSVDEPTTSGAGSANPHDGDE